MKKRELERHLIAHGCALARQAAKHELWENAATGERTVVPRHREIKTATARGICRQLGVPMPSGGVDVLLAQAFPLLLRAPASELEGSVGPSRSLQE